MTNITTTTSDQSPTQAIKSYLSAKREGLLQALPAVARGELDVDQVLATVLGSVADRPEIQECSLPSIFKAVHKSLTLGLQPDGALGHAYLVPFKKQATLIIGYRGLSHLAVKSGACNWIRAFVVRDGDEWDVSHGDGGRIFYRQSHEPLDERERLGVLTMAKLPTGDIVGEFMHASEVLKRKAISKTAGRSLMWTKFEDEGWMKTGIRHLAKLLPISNVGKAREFTAAVSLNEEEDLKDADVTVVDTKKTTVKDAETMDDLVEAAAADLPISHPDAEPPE